MKDDPSIQIVTNAQKWFVEEKIKGLNMRTCLSYQRVHHSKQVVVMEQTITLKFQQVKLQLKTWQTYMYIDNTVFALVMTGADVKEWLEMSAGQFNQIDPHLTEEQQLINEEFRTYNYDVIDGVTYEFDVTQPAKYDYSMEKRSMTQLIVLSICSIMGNQLIQNKNSSLRQITIVQAEISQVFVMLQIQSITLMKIVRQSWTT